MDTHTSLRHRPGLGRVWCGLSFLGSFRTPSCVWSLLRHTRCEPLDNHLQCVVPKHTTTIQSQSQNQRVRVFFRADTSTNPGLPGLVWEKRRLLHLLSLCCAIHRGTQRQHQHRSRSLSMAEGQPLSPLSPRRRTGQHLPQHLVASPTEEWGHL